MFLILLWTALGYKVNWRKGTNGREVPWIGAMIAPWIAPTGVAGITLSIGQERIAKLANACKNILQSEKVTKEDVRRLAGLATWISGVMPQITAYTAMIWAALTVCKGTQVERKAVAKPINWLLRLFSSQMRTVERHCRLEAPCYTLVTFEGEQYCRSGYPT